MNPRQISNDAHEQYRDLTDLSKKSGHFSANQCQEISHNVLFGQTRFHKITESLNEFCRGIKKKTPTWVGVLVKNHVGSEIIRQIQYRYLFRRILYHLSQYHRNLFHLNRLYRNLYRQNLFHLYLLYHMDSCLKATN